MKKHISNGPAPGTKGIIEIKYVAKGDVFFEGAARNNEHSIRDLIQERDQIDFFNRLTDSNLSYQNKTIQFCGPLGIARNVKKWNDWKVKTTNAAMWSCVVTWTPGTW